MYILRMSLKDYSLPIIHIYFKYRVALLIFMLKIIFNYKHIVTVY